MRLPPRWLRRVVGPLLLVAVLVVVLLLLPVLVVVAAVVSPSLPGSWRGLRLLAFAVAYLLIELAACLGAFVLWLSSGLGWRVRSPAFLRAHYALLRWVLDRLVGVARTVFSLRLETDGVSWSPLDDGVPGSANAMLVLSRHAGPGDSFLLVQSLMNRDHLRQPRIVVKDTMALDPAVDVLLHRLPARFIDPTPAAGDDVTASIGTLARGLGEEDALLIFPEGGNFSPGRRVRAIDRLRRRGHHQDADRAARMRHVLAPRPGGVTAALDAAPHADVVFVAHTGLEHLVTPRDVWRELPVNKTLHLRWWFVPAAEVPVTEEERIAWLFAQWADIDRWVAAHQEPGPY